MEKGSMMTGKFFVFLVVLLYFSQANAQFLTGNYNQEVTISRKAGELSLSVNASTFFNNNEFFGTNVEGYTLTGAFLQPVVNYSVSDNLSFGTGIHLLRYNGRSEFEQILPLFRIDYRVSETFRVTMGSFNGGSMLHLPEPLYKFENHFTSLVNNGIRLDYHGERIKSLTWLDWEHFILPGDTLQEQFTVGNSNFFTLLENETFSLTLPVHFVVHHQGGQINITDKPVISTLNFATGINMSYHFNEEKNGEVYICPLIFYDGNNETDRHGIALYPRAGISYGMYGLTAGYFRGNKFESIHGEPLFFSPLPVPAKPIPDDVRSLITFKAGIGKKITGSSSVLLRFEGYYDTNIQKLEYTYGLHLVLNENFLLKRFHLGEGEKVRE